MFKMKMNSYGILGGILTVFRAMLLVVMDLWA